MDQQECCPQDTMERLVDEYGTYMMRICCSYLQDLDQAEDAVQDAFVKIYKHWPGFKTPQEERSWVIRVTVNVCRDMLRCAWKRRVTLMDQLPDMPAPPLQLDEKGKLFEAILSLSPKYREVILLHYYQQFRVGEIAKMLHAPQSTVSVRLSRARKQLEKAIEQIPVEEL